MAFLIVIVLAGCRSPLDRAYDPDTADRDLREIGEDVDSIQARLLLGTIVRYKLESRRLEGKTYRELLSEGAAYRNARNLTANDSGKGLSLTHVRQQRLAASVSVTVLSKTHTSNEKLDHISYALLVRNRTGHSITRLSGHVLLTDLFQREIESFRVVLDKELAPNAAANHQVTVEYPANDPTTRLLRLKELDKFHVEWIPDTVVFSNGDILY